jgi:hypothetical protein
MSERGVHRRSERHHSTLLPLAAAALLSLGVASVVRDVRAQDFAGLSPADSAKLADSLKTAEEQRVADSTAFADSVAMEEEAASAEGSFGGKSSILDRGTRASHPFAYNTDYNVNRSNRVWSQRMDFRVTNGPLQVANLTSTSVGREGRVGRVNRSGQTQTELAYRLNPFLRVGGRFGIQRITDVARSTSVIGTDQSNDDLSAQVRFNKKYGPFPVQSVASYGYLRNDQLAQSSRGSNFDFYAGTNGTYRPGSTASLDLTQRVSNLNSTVSETDYEQKDRNISTAINASISSQINRWTAADGRVRVGRSTINRPLVSSAPEDTALAPQSEQVKGVDDAIDGGVHFTLPYRARLNVSASARRNQSVYRIQERSSSIVDGKDFGADLSKFVWGSDWTVRFGQSTTNNDYTRLDPGYVQTDLLRRLEGDGNHKLSASTSTRFSAGLYLTRRTYTGAGNTQSDQDQLKARGSLNFNYIPTNKFNTGMTFGLEQNDIVNIKSTASINNQRLRTYSVAWNWGVNPGSFWQVNQINTATAAQQFFTFSPSRDIVSYVYTLSTNITTNVSRKLRFDMNHLVRLQSRGSYKLEQGLRRFGKSSEFNTLDLVLREQYLANENLTFEVSQRLSVNPQFEFTGLDGHKTSENRRNELTFLTRFNYPLSVRAGLNADVRRILATDRNRTFGTTPVDRSTNGDYWLVTAGFHMDFL